MMKAFLTLVLVLVCSRWPVPTRALLANSSAQNHISAQHLRTLATNGPEPHVVIMTTASCAYRAMAANFWLHWERLGRHGQVLIIAEDRCAYDFVAEELGVLHVASALPNVDDLRQDISGNFGSREFNVVCNRRLLYILHALQVGVPVLFQDVDSIFLRDPFQFMPMGYDVVLSHDGSEVFPPGLGVHIGEFYACACLTLFTPTWGSIKLMQKWIAKSNEIGAETTHDQTHLQQVLNECKQPECHLRALMLPSVLFPSGSVYDKLLPYFRKRVAWIHANWRIGVEDKTNFLRAAGAWLVQEPPPPPAPPPSPPAPGTPPPPGPRPDQDSTWPVVV